MPVAKGTKLKCGSCKQLKRNCKCGRPTKKTESTIAILEQFLRIDSTIPEACAEARIDPSQYYRRSEKDDEFRNRMERAQHHTKMLARKTLVDNIQNGDGRMSIDYLKHRDERYTTNNKSDVNMNGGVVYLPMVEGEIIEPEALEDNNSDE